MTITCRRRDIWALIAQGLTSKEVAVKLGIEESTVRVVRRTLHKRIGVRNNVELAIAAVRHGIVEVAPSPVRPFAPRMLQQVTHLDAPASELITF